MDVLARHWGHGPEQSGLNGVAGLPLRRRVHCHRPPAWDNLWQRPWTVINYVDLDPAVLAVESLCPRCDSNAHWTDFESAASADWATGAGSISAQRTRSVTAGCVGGERRSGRTH